MPLKNSFKNEYGQIEGTAHFPYFNKEITVVCKEEVSFEYIEKCLKYLEQADEALILQICKYAEFFLKDVLENTSVGEMPDDEEAFPYDSPLDLLQYFGFNTLYIEKPPENIANSDEIYVLNLSGYCDWREDEGLQCLIRNKEVIYLGYFEDGSVWKDYSNDVIGNYVLYETFCKRLQNAKPPVIENYQPSRTQLFYDNWNSDKKGFPVSQKMTHFIQFICHKENVNVGEAVIILEDLYLYQLMNKYPKLLEESLDFWCECYRIERETDIGELACYICENCEWDMF